MHISYLLVPFALCVALVMRPWRLLKGGALVTPLMASLVLLPWLWALTALGLAAHVLRWRAQGFDYTGQMAEVGHRLRLRLGEQLRRMPLLQLQDKRTGEVNAVVLGNVDEHLNHALIVFNLLAQAVITPLAAGLALLFMAGV